MKNIIKEDFNQCLECAAPKCRSNIQQLRLIQTLMKNKFYCVVFFVEILDIQNNFQSLTLMFSSGIPSSETSPSQENEGDLIRLLQDTSPKIIN